ncbi:MAG: TatD family hydrolase [Bacteroidales bacterium]
MIYTDIHTHRTPPDTDYVLAIHSIHNLETKILPQYLYSSGIHPWYITENSTCEALDNLMKITLLPNVVAIGECGLDKLCKTPYQLQEKIFIQQAELSEEIKKPLIIHVVQSYNEIIALHKVINPTQQWIIHGFRGKDKTAEMLMRQGIYLSIGERFNPELPKAIAYDRIFVESDESCLPIETIYASAARAWSITAEQFAGSTEKLFRYVFKAI